MTRTAREAVGAVSVIHLRRPLLCAGALRVCGASRRPPPPPCSSRAVLDDELARSAAAFAARDAALGLKLLQQAFDRATADGCALERAEALRRLALADDYALRYDEARQKLNEAVTVFRRYGAVVGEAQALNQIGSTFIASGRRSEAESPLRRALDLARTIGDPPLLGRIYENLAYSVGPSPEKDRLRAEALTLARSTPGSRRLECSLLHQWGDEQFVAGRYDSAFRTITDAAACFEEVRDQSRLGRAYVSLGRVYRAHGRLDLALEQYKRALDLAAGRRRSVGGRAIAQRDRGDLRLHGALRRSARAAERARSTWRARSDQIGTSTSCAGTSPGSTTPSAATRRRPRRSRRRWRRRRPRTGCSG